MSDFQALLVNRSLGLFIGLALALPARAMGETVSIEARAKYNQAMREDQHERFFGLTFWAPNINIFRDPRWGRGQETYGEDPFLTGRMGVAFVTGMQGSDSRYLRVVSTPKHYAVHSGPEPLRHRFNVDISPHDLEDTYLPAFRATVTEAHAQSVMCAYNAIDGAPACAMAGDEVVELYLTQPKAFETPLRVLAGFQRIHVSPGESAHVSVTIDPRSLGQVDRMGNRVIVPGEYVVSLGSAQPQETTAVKTGKFSITGKVELPK
jgi:hypothetical protein